MRRFIWVLALIAAVGMPGARAAAPALATATVGALGAAREYRAEGVVEAIRQTNVAAQVPARVVAVKVRAGDRVKSGQVLIELDPRAAADQVRASDAQAAVAQAQLDAARKDYERSQRLHAMNYISQAAMDQAESQYRAAQAQSRATLAQAGIASTQSSYSRLTAPYDGVVSAVMAEQGDLASAGVALLTLYDPRELRVVATLPESLASQLAANRPVPIETALGAPGAPALVAPALQLLPTADPGTHTRQVRIALPDAPAGLVPGTYVRALLPLSGDGTGQLAIPAGAVLRRPGFDAVYVLAADGRPALRQVRLGRQVGERVEVLAGLVAGERVVLDPLAAARQ